DSPAPRPSPPKGKGEPDPLDFPFEVDVGFRLDPAPDLLAQRLDLRACRAAEIQKEITMLFRDLGVADRETTAACRVDQGPGFVPRRVLEGRAAGATPERLRFLAGASDRVHLGADRVWVAGRAAEHSFDDDGAGGHGAVAVGRAELLGP